MGVEQAGELLLFGAPGSGSAAIEMRLRQLGLPYRVERAASWEPGPGFERLKTLNPLGQIPTLLLPGGQLLTESAAILIHLGLPPGDDGLRCLRGLVFIAANCYSAVSISDFPERWTTTPDGADAVRAAARLRLHEAWAVFADAFHDEARWLSGAEPGALDFLAVVVSRWSGSRAALAASRPGFHALLLRLQQHPRVAAVLVEHWPT
jgi:GST-like protein